MDSEKVKKFLAAWSEILALQPWIDDGGSIVVVAMDMRGFAESLHADIDIHSIEADNPGNGWGSAVLALLCALADERGVSLHLEALGQGDEAAMDDESDDGAIAQGDLERFYGKFGFFYRGTFSHADMLRAPREPTPASVVLLGSARRGESPPETSGSDAARRP